MTWRELAEFIAKMPLAQIDQSVRFVEPYDEGRQGYVLEPVVAAGDIYIGEEAEEAVFVNAGEPLLG